MIHVHVVRFTGRKCSLSQTGDYTRLLNLYCGFNLHYLPIKLPGNKCHGIACVYPWLLHISFDWISINVRCCLLSERGKTVCCIWIVHKMGKMHVFVHTFALSFMCLHVLCCLAYPELQSGLNDMTLTVGETLTLEYTFLEYVGEEYIVWWTKAELHIGACNMDRDTGSKCYKFSNFSHDSRIIVVQMERRYFQLLIYNTTISDAGIYEFRI